MPNLTYNTQVKEKSQNFFLNKALKSCKQLIVLLNSQRVLVHLHTEWSQSKMIYLKNKCESVKGEISIQLSSF